jgi:hypothetical protein
VAIRFHVAQHGYLSHMNLRLGSGLAGLMQIGNEIEDVHFFDGRYGIITENTSPFWPFTILDSTFEGQRDAAIREHMAQLTVVRSTFRRVPVAVDVDPQYSDQVWLEDSRFEDVSNAIVVIGLKNPETQIGIENATCSNVPVSARFREADADGYRRSTASRISLRLVAQRQHQPLTRPSAPSRRECFLRRCRCPALAAATTD